MQIKNQVHNPQPKKKRIDDKGNDIRRMFIKDGNTTMLLCKGTENGCKALNNAIYSFAKRLGIKIETQTLITR